MLSSTEYMIVWACYLLSAAGLTLAWWRLTSAVAWSQLRQVLRALIVMLLFTPWTLEGQPQFWAPAFIVASLDALSDGVQAASRAGIPLLVAELVGLIVSFSYYFASSSKESEASR